MKTTVPDKIKAHIIMTDTGEKTFFMRWLPVLTLTLCTFCLLYTSDAADD